MVDLEGDHSINSLPEPAFKQPETAFNVAILKVTSDMTWSALEHLINGSIMSHFSDVSVGLRTRKTNRLDCESPESPTPYMLGLSTDSIKQFAIGTTLCYSVKPVRSLIYHLSCHLLADLSKDWCSRYISSVPTDVKNQGKPEKIKCSRKFRELLLFLQKVREIQETFFLMSKMVREICILVRGKVRELFSYFCWEP